MMGNSGGFCNSCGDRFENTPLLYPVAEKGYQDSEFISRQWATLEALLKKAFMVTVFGYGAPVSDTASIDFLKNAWGTSESRSMEEFEIIDIRKEEELVDTWSPFIHSHHYRVESSFYDSWIANHPRRTGEAYLNQFYYAKFIENNPLPKDAGFNELWDWYGELSKLKIYKAHNNHIQPTQKPLRAFRSADVGVMCQQGSIWHAMDFNSGCRCVRHCGTGRGCG